MKNNNIYNNSPFESLNTIKKQFHFNSPSETFNPKNKFANLEDRECNDNASINNPSNEDMNNLKMNLNDNKYSEIRNVHNNIHVNFRSENNNLIQDFAKTTGLFNGFSNENYFINDENANNGCNFLNNPNASFNSNLKRSIIKKSNNNAALNNLTSIDNENSCINLNLNKTNISNTKRVPLGKSEILNKVLGSSNDSINLNITPDNKKNKTNCVNERNIFNISEKNYKGYSFSELQYMDKENIPPVPRESSRFNNTNELSSPLEINIELGISHLNSDQSSQRTLEIPITIDTKHCYDDKENIKSDSEIPLIKEYLVIFNTLSLDLNQILEFLRIASDKMNHNDKLYSNIFSNEAWVKKGDLEFLLNLENKLHFFQNINYLNTEGIIQAIDFCVEISLENDSNIFSVIIINELKDFYEFNGNNVKDDL